MTQSVASAGKDRRFSGPVRYLVCLSVLCGIALIGLGLPRTISAWASMAGEQAYTALSKSPAPSGEAIANGIEGLRFAISVVPSPGRYSKLAGLEIAQAQRLAIDDPHRKALLERAEQHLDLAITGNPTDGWACMLLAGLRRDRGASPREILAPVVHSLDVSPNLRELWVWRAELLLAYWPALRPEELSIMRSQFRTIWNTDPKMRRPLTELAVKLGQVWVLTWTLDGGAEALGEIARLTHELAAVPKAQ